MNGKVISQSTNSKANAASASSSLLRFPYFIIDSGVTDYITSSLNLLVNSSENTIFTTSYYAKWRIGSNYIYWDSTLEFYYMFEKIYLVFHLVRWI